MVETRLDSFECVVQKHEIGKVDVGLTEKTDLSAVRCALLDPSNFTPPYDQALCASLSDLGLQVTWFGRAIRADDPFGTDGHLPEPFFYRLSERLRGRAPNFIGLLVKAVEHTYNMAKLPHELIRRKFDVVHFQWTPIPLLDHRVIRKIRKSIPVILTVHDTAIFHGNSSHTAQRHGWDKVLRGVDAVIVHVNSVIESLVDLGVERNRIHLIPHPIFPKPDKDIIDSALVKYSSESLGFCDGKVNFLLFGRLAPYKGLDTLLAALEKIPSETKTRMRVVLAGRAAFDVATFRQEIEAAGLQDTLIINAKFLPEEELIAYLARCDVALFPYHDIDASGALMQALPYSPAIIASRIGVFEELLDHQKTALLVEPADAKALAEVLARMVTDESLRESIRAEVDTVTGDKLSWPVAARSTAKLYRQAMAVRASTV